MLELIFALFYFFLSITAQASVFEIGVCIKGIFRLNIPRQVIAHCSLGYSQ